MKKNKIMKYIFIVNSLLFLSAYKIDANDVKNNNEQSKIVNNNDSIQVRDVDRCNSSLEVKEEVGDSVNADDRNKVCAEDKSRVEIKDNFVTGNDNINISSSNQKTDTSSVSSEIFSNLKYKNYDCQENCLNKKKESYNLIDRYGRFKNSLNDVIFNMCLECASKKVSSDNPKLFKRNEKNIYCSIEKILDLLPDCCPSCYNNVFEAIVLAYYNCPHQFTRKYNISKTDFENDGKSDSYKTFLYSLQSRTVQKYLDQKKDYESYLKEIKDIDDEIKRVDCLTKNISN